MLYVNYETLSAESYLTYHVSVNNEFFFLEHYNVKKYVIAYHTPRVYKIIIFLCSIEFEILLKIRTCSVIAPYSYLFRCNKVILILHFNKKNVGKEELLSSKSELIVDLLGEFAQLLRHVGVHFFFSLIQVVGDSWNKFVVLHG